MTQINARAVLTKVADIATKEAVKAHATFESVKLNNVISLSALMCANEAHNIMNETGISKTAFKNAWTGFIKRKAYSGEMVWSGSDTAMDAIRRFPMGSKARINAAAEYIDKKEKGSRLVDGLANVKTWFKRVVDDVTANKSAIIRNAIANAESGMDGETVYNNLVKDLKAEYGSEWNALVSMVAPPPPVRNTDAVESCYKAAVKLSDGDLATLIEKLNAQLDERKAYGIPTAEGLDDAESEAESILESESEAPAPALAA